MTPAQQKPRTCEVKAHKRTLPASVLGNPTTAALLAYVNAKGHKFRRKARRKVL